MVQIWGQAPGLIIASNHLEKLEVYREHPQASYCNNVLINYATKVRLISDEHRHRNQGNRYLDSD